jgi:uncharacterized protein (TIGR00251 family)
MLRSHPEGVVVDVWVVPGSSRDLVGGTHDGALRVRTASPPEGGAANRAVARLVAEALGARAGRVIAGHRSRRKQVLVIGADEAAAGALLETIDR